MRARAGIALAAALVFGVGLGARDFWEPDEPRHGAIAEEMRALRFGPAQLVVPRLNGEVYSQKPPLYYWLAALAGTSSGFVSEGAARFPSALAALVTALAVCAFGGAALGRSAGLAAAAFLITTPAFVDVARNARPDALLAMFVTCALWLTWRIDRGIGSAASNRRVLHLAIGLGLLTKGPVAALLPLLGYAGYLAWERRLRDLGQLFSRGSWLLSVGLAAVWLVAAVLLAPSGFFDDAVAENLFGRYFSGASHEQPLGYYLRRLPVACLPWSLLWPVAALRLRSGLRRDADPERRSALRFLIAFVGAGFLFFTLSSGKRMIYLVPLFPALALLSSEAAHGVGPAVARVLRARPAFAALGATVAIAVAILLASAAARAGLPAAALGIGLGVAALAVLLPWERLFGTEAWLTRGFALLVVGQVAVFGWLLPRFDSGRSIRGAAVVAAAFAPRGTPIGLLRNGSLVGGVAYYSRRPVEQIGSERGLRKFLAAGGRTLVLETPWLPGVESVVRARVVFRQELDGDEVLVVLADGEERAVGARDAIRLPARAAP